MDDPEKTWFTSDTHWGHANVIKYAGRPYTSVDEMNEAMISNWNSVVGHDHVVYHLGDIALCHTSDVKRILGRLNGRKRWVFGNHDKGIRKDPGVVKFFEKVADLLEIKVQDLNTQTGHQPITLCHYAMKVWNKRHYGAWQLYGHSHGSMPDDPESLSLDVGVDVHGYRPISYEEVKTRMSVKTWRPVDHHGATGDER